MEENVIFKDWQPQLFWSGLTAIAIPTAIYFIGVWRDRRLFFATLSKIDCAPYLLYFSIYYDILEKFARGADRPVTSETALISFQNISGHLLSTILNMKSDVAEAAKYAYGIKSIGVRSALESKMDQLIMHLDVLHKVVRTHEVWIIGRASVFPEAGSYNPQEVSEITFDHVKLPVEEIIKLLRRKPEFNTRADEQQAELTEYSSPMNLNIRQQKGGYAELLRWIKDNSLISTATTA